MRAQKFKQICLGAGLLTMLPLFSSAPITENKEIKWDDTLKAVSNLGRVKKMGKIIFHVKHEGNAVYISLPRKITLMEIDTWIFEINKDGQVYYANWDKQSQSWKFNLMGPGIHKVFVSKRMTNLETAPYAWFVLN
jgi:hypothetical protein